MTHKLFELLSILPTDSFYTSQELANKLGVSEKTIRTRMKELNSILETNGAEVISKRHLGYQLNIINEQAFLNLTEQITVQEVPDGIEERQNFLLEKLLASDKYLKLDDIAEELFVSRQTLFTNVKRVEEILSSYDLSIDRKPNYGIKVIGNEFDKRTCIVNNLYVRRNSTEKEQWLANMIILGNQKHKVNMSEISLDNFIKYVIVSLERIKRGHPLDSSDIQSKDISEATQFIVNNYCENIETEFNIILSDTERLFLAIHFSSQLSSDSYSQYGPNFVITGKIDELVFKMLTRVYDTFSINFRNNLELRMSLNQHLVPMDIRLRYNIPITNPLLEVIKKEYTYPFTLAMSACTSLSEYYRKEIPEDEVAYIALIFALATEKRARQIEKKNIVLVCVSGTSSSQLFKFKYKQAFGAYLNDIYDCSVAELDLFDFKGKKIDYIFTTVPLKHKYAVPIYEINLIIDTKDILTYQELFESSSSKLLNYYSTNLFIPNLKAETREEAIKKMCDHIDRYDLLPYGFYEAVMKREELGQTDFGNLVALPHPYKILTKTSFVTVAVLEKPIMWKNHHVQVVFLLAIGSQEDSHLEKFYEKTSSLFFNQKAIQTLIKHPNFETLLSILD
ncbi:BglG family transcription antiterminator [Streptococcus henryi]|uniref:BglG family transcription antiterminator n=1 Tax=Streptococcus henryi TaxID=439219 RepID=UPI00036E1697|nr:BglG family transcription antiterminator [Streptococcus henryi]